MRQPAVLIIGAAAVSAVRQPLRAERPLDWVTKCPSSECQNFTWSPPAAIPSGIALHVDAAGRLTERNHLLAGCGEICDTSARPAAGEVLRKRVDCPALFANTAADAPAALWPPPTQPPATYRNDFLMGDDGSVGYRVEYYAQRLSGTDGAFGDALNAGWSQRGIDSMIWQASTGALFGGYGHEETQTIAGLVMNHKAQFAGKRLLVLGSLTPWLEAILLHAGAAHVTTVEYGSLPKNPHPKVSTLTPAELAQAFHAGTAPKFQGGASYSSIEHSGLGRYGDTVNPWGDLQAIAKLWCVMEPGSLFVLGVPSGADTLEWNAHRRYGPRRLPHLMANWEHLESSAPVGPYGQVSMVYRKLE